MLILKFNFIKRSTWAKYHSGIDQGKVVEFAKEIKTNGFANSQIEIDDKWEPHYGDFAFDTKKFPNAKDMVSHLKSEGFRTTLWVYPFVNKDSEVFHKENKHFIKDKNGTVLVSSWWNGVGAHVDFTDKEAQNWFVSRLEHIRNSTGIDSFKFDAGELGWVNHDFLFHDKTIQQTPSLLSKVYAETVSRLGILPISLKAIILLTFFRKYDRNEGRLRCTTFADFCPNARQTVSLGL